MRSFTKGLSTITTTAVKNGADDLSVSMKLNRFEGMGVHQSPFPKSCKNEKNVVNDTTFLWLEGCNIGVWTPSISWFCLCNLVKIMKVLSHFTKRTSAINLLG